MELSSLEGSLLSSIPDRRSPAISRQCVITYNRGFRNSSILWRRSLDLDRVGLVLSRGVKSKEDLKEDWELNEGEEKSDFWNPLDLLEDLRVKLDSDTTYKILVYGSGVLAALLITSAITSAIDSIPLVPKLLEVVGLSYTVWFSVRYLIFKDNRDELFAKVDDLKNQIFGDSDD
ncbi:protein CURVATURE THYLAKOID 1D [Carex littledalei]|uniref:Protein CURVATURE THYLAKOID 1D n=1 Tax=Carex littledalei TaxID=544730 RepID=A0A833RU52_9POAL|nr:protein CURVATURE THYLAKOID 1D [Carex littledalei]